MFLLNVKVHPVNRLCFGSIYLYSNARFFNIRILVSRCETSVVILTKVLSFGSEIAKEITLSNNNKNNSIEQTLKITTLNNLLNKI